MRRSSRKCQKLKMLQKSHKNFLLGATKIGDLVRELKKLYIFFGRSSELDTGG